jgi:iron complex outermembrane receptor protein
MKRIFQITVLSLLFSHWANAQDRPVSGTVTDETGAPFAGVNIVVKGTSTGTLTDTSGKYLINVPSTGTTFLVFSFVGFATQEVAVPESGEVNVQMDEVVSQLDEVVITVGSRVTQRTITDTPLPVDVLSSRDLSSTGQLTFDKALQYRVPSFNTVQTPVNDATSLLDPYEIRNMGPSRTLILINGKRKNASSLIYTQTSPGRGETGADISAIPTDAIKRVNIILKDDAEVGSVTFRAGITGEGDGEMAGISLNNGSKLGKSGFLNYTLDFSKVGLAARSGDVNAEGEAGDFGAALGDVQAFLAKMPDAGNINGSPETTAAKFLVNGGVDVTDNTNIYFNAAYVYKKVNSFANYRTPYWRTLTDYPYLADFFGDGTPQSYVGYVPTFDGDLGDYNATIGFKTVKNDWSADVSLTLGGNRQTYTVRNTHNRNTAGLRNPDTYLGDLNDNGVVDADEMVEGSLKYLENSPVTFRAGGSRFNHVVGNIDISRPLSEKVTLSFGSEFRSETFETIEGDLASYEAGGADSFAGNSAENSFTSNRYNIGGYLSFGFDITEDFLIDATGRYENYSDFGDAFVYKLSTRYKLLDDQLTIRGSYSTGFRAPSLHQIYTQKAQYSFVPGQGIQVSGLANNVSREANLLGVPKLDAEKSQNLTIGLGVKPSDNFSITLDYYNIRVEDRIVLSKEIGPSGDPTQDLDQILAENGIVSLSFFTNSMDTKTSGLDLVASYRGIEMGTGALSFNLAGNYQIENERDGAITNPDIVEEAGQSVLDATQEALIFTSRPEYKGILGIDLSLGKFIFSLNNTLFGPTKFRNAGMSSDLQIEFQPKLVTDLGITFQATKNTTIALNINNIFDVLPEWKFVALNAEGAALMTDQTPVPGYFGLTPLQVQDNLITFNQRYPIVTYDGSHFSQLGTMMNLAVNVRF